MKLRKGRAFAILLFLLGVLLIGGSFIYTFYTSPIDKESNASIEVIIPSGMSTVHIAKLLETKGLIRNASFFRLFLKLNQVKSLKADVYLLKKSMSLKEIIDTISKGSHYNPDAITITFQEGKTMRQYAALLSSKTTIKEEDFLNKMQDRAFVKTLFQDYWFLTESILDQDIYYPLEGYLAPDTYQFKNKNVTVEEVARTLLDQMEKNLEPFRTTLLEKQNVHAVLTLASMAELEGKTEEDRKKIVGVFQNRLNRGMSLGSDVTTYYAFQEEMTSDLPATMFNTYHPYNTRSEKMAGKLPIGPICNPDLSSIKASLSPTVTDYYYFVADKNGKIYYTKTIQEHNKTVQEIKDRGDWIW